MTTTRKGVSLMVSLALILALTVAVGGILTVFFQQTGEEQVTETGEQARQDIECGNAGLQITGAIFHQAPTSGEGNFTSVTVKNTGTVNLPSGVVIAVFTDDRLVNETDILSTLRVEEERTATFLTNTSVVSEVQARAADCPSKTSTATGITNQTYVATPETGVS